MSRHNHPSGVARPTASGERGDGNDDWKTPDWRVSRSGSFANAVTVDPNIVVYIVTGTPGNLRVTEFTMADRNTRNLNEGGDVKQDGKC